MVRQTLIALIILLCFALFEASILSNILFLPAVPDFLLICAIYLSVNNGKFFGTVLGFSSGLFFDFLTASPLGFHCLLRTLIGYFSGLLNKSLNLSGFFVPFIFGFLSTIAKYVLIFFISLFFPSINPTIDIFSVPFVFELAANAILTPIVFRFLDVFSEKLLLAPELVA